MVASINRGTRQLEGAYVDAVEVTKDDEDVLAITSALWVGTTGDVAVRMAASGTSVIFASVPDGTLLKICVDQVLATGTSAGSFVALY